MRKPVDGRVSDCIRQHIEDATDIEMNIPAKKLVRQIRNQAKCHRYYYKLGREGLRQLFYLFRCKRPKSVTPHTQEPGLKE